MTFETDLKDDADTFEDLILAIGVQIRKFIREICTKATTWATTALRFFVIRVRGVAVVGVATTAAAGGVIVGFVTPSGLGVALQES